MTTRAYDKWVFQYEDGRFYRHMGNHPSREVSHKADDVFDANGFDQPDKRLGVEGTWRKIKTTITVELCDEDAG